MESSLENLLYFIRIKPRGNIVRSGNRRIISLLRAIFIQRFAVTVEEEEIDELAMNLCRSTSACCSGLRLRAELHQRAGENICTICSSTRATTAKSQRVGSNLRGTIQQVCGPPEIESIRRGSKCSPVNLQKLICDTIILSIFKRRAAHHRHILNVVSVFQVSPPLHAGWCSRADIHSSVT